MEGRPAPDANGRKSSRRWVAPVLRIAVGLVFVVSGLEKLLSPPANFLYVIRSYDVLPDGLARLTAVGFPWIEFLTGVFLVLGLETRFALAVALIMTMGFLGMVGQAMVRRLPLDSCGCFGDLISVPLPLIFLSDLGLAGVLAGLRRAREAASSWSLDRRLGG